MIDFCGANLSEEGLTFSHWSVDRYLKAVYGNPHSIGASKDDDRGRLEGSRFNAYPIDQAIFAL
jgi:hypothetical protein